MTAPWKPLAEVHDDERGFSLIELIVSSMLTVLIMALVGSIVITGLKSSNLNTRIVATATQAELASSVITGAVRNASAISATPLSGTGQVLRARVGTLASPNSTSVAWGCQAWLYLVTSTGNAIYTKTSPSAIAAPSAVTRLDLEQPAGSAPENKDWVLLVDGVSMPSGSTVPFTVAGKTLLLNFLVTSATTSAIRIKTTTMIQPQIDTTGAPTSCT